MPEFVSVTKSHSGAGLERFSVQNFDCAARRADQPPAGKVLQEAADDFTRTAQFGGDLLMGDAERVLDPAAAQEKGGQTSVHATEGYFLDHSHHAGKALREQVKDEATPQVV